MKELSIEEKAQRYDEALGKDKKELDACGSQDCDAARQIFRFFPELKKNEDEKIRKELIQYLKDYPNLPTGKYCRNDFFTWLEKQGEQKTLCDKCSCQDITELGRCAVEHEQKSADTIKPKFKVGDWIVNDTFNITACIKDITYHYNTYTPYGIGCIEFENENNWHLWTIQDAKDGDVLVASDGSIFLLKGVIDGACKHYVALTIDNVVRFNEGLEHRWETSTSVHPATKEQRDLLFQKMKEAGYEWASENKVLRKVEQKPEIDDNVLSRFAFYQYDNDTIYLSSVFVEECNRKRGYGSKILKAAEEVAKTLGISKIRLKVERNTWIEEWYKKNGYEYLSSEGKYNWLENRIIDIKPDKIEQKSAWSEEDKVHLFRCINYFTGITEFSLYYKDFLWLKSLKERMKGE